MNRQVDKLDSRVLVLNKLWQAVNICTVRRAFCLLCLGHAKVVAEEGGSFSLFDFEKWLEESNKEERKGNGDIVRTVRLVLKIPRIILLLFYDAFPAKEVRFTRKNVYERDRNTCQYCGKVFEAKHLNIDHVTPKTRGGQTCWENVVSSCHKCNSRKGNRTLQEAGIKFIRKPRKPTWPAFVTVGLHTHLNESWRKFVDVSHWNVNVEIGDESVDSP